MKLRFDDILEDAIACGKIQPHIAEITDFLDCIMGELCELSHEKYEHMTAKFIKKINDGMFTETIAKYAVSHMENKDPKCPKGEHWNYDAVAMIAKECGLPVADVGLPAIYFTLNMMRSDYFDAELPADEVKHYADLTKDFLLDKDIANYKCKAFNYWYHIVKGY